LYKVDILKIFHHQWISAAMTPIEQKVGLTSGLRQPSAGARVPGN
jgi:hypothetical protein